MTDLQKICSNLNLIIGGLTSSENRVWATVKPWTKKERDEAILNLAQQTREIVLQLLNKQDTDCQHSGASDVCELCGKVLRY